MSFLSDDSLVQHYKTADDVFNRLIEQDSIYLSKRKSLKHIITRSINSFLLIEEGRTYEDICHASIHCDELYVYVILYDRYKDELFRDKIMSI